MKEEILSDLEVLLGNWESVNLNPTIVINRNKDFYLLSIIHVSETSQQAQPTTYEILSDEISYYIFSNLKRINISYDKKIDLLTLSTLGDYTRN